MADKKITNEFTIDIDELCEEEGFESDLEMLSHFFNESVVPACCSESCQVEPDGTCEHGNESFLLAMGVI